MHLGIEGECEPCPRGTYRTQGVEPACQQCPAGRTTKQSGASSIEECSLPVCVPGNKILPIQYYNNVVWNLHLTESDNVIAGTYLNTTQNSCISCKKGTYQPATQQTICLPCPPNMSTKTVAAVSILY